MHKREEFRIDTRDLRQAIGDYLIKHKLIETPDMVQEITFYAEPEGGDECNVVVKTVNEKVEGT